jgi:hypothetical protein
LSGKLAELGEFGLMKYFQKTKDQVYYTVTFLKKIKITKLFLD